MFHSNRSFQFNFFKIKNYNINQISNKLKAVQETTLDVNIIQAFMKMRIYDTEQFEVCTFLKRHLKIKNHHSSNSGYETLIIECKMNVVNFICEKQLCQRGPQASPSQYRSFILVVYSVGQVT